MAVEFTCQRSGLRGLRWANSDNQGCDGAAVVALHGWLDNAASFQRLAPLLPSGQITALDLPGHGLSACKPEGADYAIWNYTADVRAHLLSYDAPVDLVAHSMGGSVALFVAAAFPELVRSLVLLDSPGPIITPENQLARQLRDGILALEKDKAPRLMESESLAVAIRHKATPNIPIPELEMMVSRNLVPTAGGYLWRTDPRLKLASKVRLTEGQVQGLMQSVECPVLAIRAEQGMIPAGFFSHRMAYLRNCRSVEVPGYHHFHLEVEGSVAIAALIREFQESL